MRLRVLHTPGHTHHHVSYVLSDAGDSGAAVSGGVHRRVDALRRHRPHRPGRPRVDTVELTHAQYRSVRRLADELPAEAAVLPTHGFGSFCSATPTSGEASTVGEQARVNPALTLAEQDFVDTLLAGLDAYPAYYAHMGPINRRGPAPVDLSAPRTGRARRAAPPPRGRRVGGRPARAHRVRRRAPGRLAGVRAVGTNFVTYLGWLYRYGTPLTLIGETPEQVADARRELVRIGIDRLAGAATGDIDTLADGQALRSYPVTDFAGLAKALRAGAGAGPRRPPQRRTRRRVRRRARSTSRCTSCPTASTRSRRARCGSTAARATAPRSRPRSSTAPAGRSC